MKKPGGRWRETNSRLVRQRGI